jgi:hypothetical protein
MRTSIFETGTMYLNELTDVAFREGIVGTILQVGFASEQQIAWIIVEKP